MPVLLDTNVLIDVVRGLPAAVAFVEQLPRQPSISVITLAELHAGAKSRREEATIASMEKWFTLHDVNAAIAQRTGQFIKHYKFSHGIDDFDAVIAATAEHFELKLATLNLKHFPMFPQLKPAY